MLRSLQVVAYVLWLLLMKNLTISHKLSSSLPICMDWKGSCMCLLVLSSSLSLFHLSLPLGLIGVSLISRVLTQLGLVSFGFGYEHHSFIVFLSAYFIPFVVEHHLVLPAWFRQVGDEGYCHQVSPSASFSSACKADLPGARFPASLYTVIMCGFTLRSRWPSQEVSQQPHANDGVLQCER